MVWPSTRQMKPYRFGKAPLLAAFSNLPGFGNNLHRCCVDRRRNRKQCGYKWNHVRVNTAWVLVQPGFEPATPARSILHQVYILRVIGFLLETQQHFMIFICSQFSQMVGSVYLLPLLHYQTVLDMHNLGQMKRKNISFAYWVVY